MIFGMMEPSTFEKWSGLALFKRVHHLVGGRFMAYMFVMYFCLKGMLAGSGDGILQSGITPYFRYVFQASGNTRNIGSVVSYLPFHIKPLIGAISDILPLFGYHKRYYIVICAFLGTATYLVLALAPVDNASADIAVSFSFVFFLGILECAVTEVLCEGTYSRIMQEHPYSGGDIPTFACLMMTLGGLLASQLVGYISSPEYLGPKYIFLIGIPFALSIIPPSLLGWLPEAKVSMENGVCNMSQIRFARRHWRLVTFGLIISLTAVVHTLLAAFVKSNTVLFIETLTVIVINTCCSFYFLEKQVAMIVTYTILSKVLLMVASTNGQYEAFYIGKEVCLPGDSGPHFQLSFWIGNTSLVTNIMYVIATYAFGMFTRTWKIRSALAVTTVLIMVACIFDIIIIMRWNVGVISDKVLYMIGEPVVTKVVTQLNWMIMFVLWSKVCPKGVESTMFGLIASCSNSALGMILANVIATWMGLKTACQPKTASGCDCNLGGGNPTFALFIVICHILMPSLLFPLMYWLIPDVRMCETLELRSDPGNKTTVDKETGFSDCSTVP